MRLLQMITITVALYMIAPDTTAQGNAVKEEVRTFNKPNGEPVDIISFTSFLKETMDSLKIPGISIAVINDNKMVYHNALGVMNSETKEPVTKETLFEAASLSKPIFAYFAMKMVQKGTLELDKPVKEYLPHPGIDSASREYYELITPRMILSHSAGFPNWSDGEPINIPFKPGMGFSYSGEAYQYLAAIIGVLNKVGWEHDLDSVFQEEVAKPLQLNNSFFTPWGYGKSSKATGHKGGKPTDALPMGKSFGAGYSLHTEASDFAKFIIELLDPKNLNKELLDEMLNEQSRFPENHELLESGQTGWGLGLARKPTENGLRYLHTGNNQDFQSYMCFYPESGYGLVFFINSDKIEPFYEKVGKYLEDEF